MSKNQDRTINIYAHEIWGKNYKQEAEKKIKEQLEKQAKREIETKLEIKARKMREYRKEASRKASMANKRIQRLEKSDLKASPAYQKFIEGGGQKFSVRGKSHNELQKEVARLNNFIGSKTSTIRGTTKVLREMGENTGIKFKNLADLKAKSSQFFELAGKVDQYLRTVDDMASAVGYQKIWTAINQYVERERIDLTGSMNDIDKMILDVTKAMEEYDEKVTINTPSMNGWFKLER